MKTCHYCRMPCDPPSGVWIDEDPQAPGCDILVHFCDSNCLWAWWNGEPRPADPSL